MDVIFSEDSPKEFMKLSIVTTLYKSQAYVREFHERCVAIARQHFDKDFEIIFVNDGSPDTSVEIACDIAKACPHTYVIDLSRNFGHHKAMMAGLDHAKGERIFLIDSDLEEAPEWLTDFMSVMKQEDADTVYGVQRRRKGGWFERLSGDLYYSFLNLMVGIKHPRNITTARLMTHRYVQALLEHREREIVISFLWIITGLNRSSPPLKNPPRAALLTLYEKNCRCRQMPLLHLVVGLLCLGFSQVWLL